MRTLNCKHRKVDSITKDRIDLGLGNGISTQGFYSFCEEFLFWAEKMSVPSSDELEKESHTFFP